MRHPAKRRPRRLAVIGAAMALFLLTWQGGARADDPLGGGTDPVTDLTDQLQGKTQTPNAPASPSGTTVNSVPNNPSSDGDTGGHETDNPQEPNHASSSVLNLDIAGNDFIDIGETNSQINGNGSSQGDVTVLALGGMEIAGAHSSSSGPQHSTFPPSSGCVGPACLELLFADTQSHSNAHESSSRSDTNLAAVCISDTGECDVVFIGAASAHSRIHRDKDTGATDADSSSDLAEACVLNQSFLPDGAVGARSNQIIILPTCTIGAGVMHSESHSEAPSHTHNGSTERSSYLLGLNLGPSFNPVLTDPTGIELPPGCPAGMSLLCVYFNQGESFVYVGGGASAQEAFHLGILPGIVPPNGADVLTLHLATAETLAENPGPRTPPCCKQVSQPPTLAFTGFGGMIAVAVALNLMVAGLMLTAWDRRRVALRA